MYLTKYFLTLIYNTHNVIVRFAGESNSSALKRWHFGKYKSTYNSREKHVCGHLCLERKTTVQLCCLKRRLLSDARDSRVKQLDSVR